MSGVWSPLVTHQASWLESTRESAVLQSHAGEYAVEKEPRDLLLVADNAFVFATSSLLKKLRAYAAILMVLLPPCILMIWCNTLHHCLWSSATSCIS